MTVSVLAVSVARSDFGILVPVLSAIRARDALQLRVAATGMHLSERFGMTVNEMIESGFSPDFRIPTIDDTDDTPAGTSRAIAAGVRGFANLFETDPPDILLLLGDRFEVFAAAAAAVPYPIAIAHIHGGELSFGAIDEQMRHAISKLSHLHFPATPAARARLLRMGEEPHRITLAGAPALDVIREWPKDPDRSLATLSAATGIPLEHPPILMTYHPVTREVDGETTRISLLIDKLAATGRPVVATAPNADANGRRLLGLMESLSSERENFHLVANLGQELYYHALCAARLMVGNSSSGIIEAASFGLPVINIGDRQAGRETSENVIHARLEEDSLTSAFDIALSEDFDRRCKSVNNIYDQGGGADRIADTLAGLTPEPALLVKQFYSGDTP